MVFFTRKAQFYRWAQVALVPTEASGNAQAVNKFKICSIHITMVRSISPLIY